MDQVGRLVADAVLGIDTLWGGDVMCASGTGRFIADSWFSDEPLPAAYTVPAAARVRESCGVASKKVDREAVEEYLRRVDLPQAIAGIREEAARSAAGAASICRACRLALIRCGTSPWKCSGRACQFPTRAVWSPQPAGRRNPQARKPNGNVWLSCWAARVTQPPVLPACSGRSMPGGGIA